MYESALNSAESFVDFHVRKTPIGNSANVEMKAPINGVISPSFASFFPDMSTTQYTAKKSIEITTGVPSPPFLIIAPSGAPMKKNMIQAMESVNFLKVS